MGETENNSSVLGLIKNLKDDVTKNKKNCQSEAIDLFKKILKAIDAHTDTQRVNKGLDDLAVGVCDLEAKLSIIANERDNLLHLKQLKLSYLQYKQHQLPHPHHNYQLYYDYSLVT